MDNLPCPRCPRLTCRQVAVTLTALVVAIFLVYNLSCCISITGRNEIITASDGFHLRLGLDFTARSRSEQQIANADSNKDSRWSKRSSSSSSSSPSIGHQPSWTLYELRKHVSKKRNSKKHQWPLDNIDVELDNEVSESEMAASDQGVVAASGGALAPYLYRKGNFTALRKLPQALIIGVKKGGTRALLEYIRLHPDIRAVGPEMHFFDRHYYRGLDWYRRHMPRSLEGQLTMEKTPSYFVTRQVPRRVSDMSKDTKLLIVVRDPVTRAISDYTQTLSKRHDLKRFEELAFLGNTSGVVDTSWAAIRIGIYAKHLERWLHFFPRNQLHFVSGERLIKDPAGEMALVQDFLGLRRVITEQHFYFNETKGFPCLKKSEHNASPKCLGLTKGRSHPVIDLAAIQRLRDFYRPFNAKFYLMTGVNFGWP